MESLELFHKVYGATYQEARRLSEIAHCRYTVWLIMEVSGRSRTVQNEWTGLHLQQMTRFAWYFRYRAALLQISNPRSKIYMEINKTYETIDQRTDLIRTIKNKTTNAKAKLTQATLRLNAITSGWSELFPVDQHPHYDKVINELEQRRERIRELESDMAATEHDDIFDLLKKHHIV